MSKFELGDKAVVMGYYPNYSRDKREPQIEGTVTARGKSCVRLRWRKTSIFNRLTVMEKWFTIDHYDYHVEKTEEY